MMQFQAATASPANRQPLFDLINRSDAIVIADIDSAAAARAFLLDSPDEIRRELAVGGFGLFVTNTRISEGGLDAAEALDKVLNPGRRRKLPSADAPYETPETRKFLNFGFFRNSGEEAAYLAFWKGWYEQHRAQLGL
ncbi:MAG: hypothetical protein ACR2I2_21435 [Bryobacteraceae bacterium]